MCISPAHQSSSMTNITAVINYRQNKPNKSISPVRTTREMAAVSDYFSLGSTVWCKTCYSKEIEGEVMAFDPQSKMLILKCPTVSGPRLTHDVHLVNLTLVSELIVKKEVTAVPEIPQSLNLERLSIRIRNQIDDKKRTLQAMSANVSPEGQRLYIAIAKMIKEVRWNSSDIVVWENKVIISPPYKLENIKGNASSGEYTYIRKIVERHIKDPSSTTVQNNSNM